VPTALELNQWLRERTEAFKVPRQWWICEHWPHTASGKTDHGQLAQALRARMTAPADAAISPALLPALRPWQS
jgi:non-ribosomal peptide synthetase component E (peptide arylation enzyme)